MTVEIIDFQTRLPLKAAVAIRNPEGNTPIAIGTTDDTTGEKDFVFNSDVLRKIPLVNVLVQHKDYHRVEMRNVKTRQNLRIALVPLDADGLPSSEFDINPTKQSKWMVNPFKLIGRKIKNLF